MDGFNGGTQPLHLAVKGERCVPVLATPVLCFEVVGGTELKHRGYIPGCVTVMVLNRALNGMT